MRIFKFLLLSSSFLIFACKSKQKAEDTPPHVPFAPEMQVEEEEIRSYEDTFRDEERFRYKNCSPILAARKRTSEFESQGDVIFAELKGECLTVDIQYSGCQIAKTTLYWEQIEGSQPPEIVLLPGVQNTGECDQLLDNIEDFDLGAIKGLGTGEVILKVANLQPIRYLYAPR